jgi:hypothetical protein
MADDPRALRLFTGVALGIGLLALVFGVWRALTDGLLVNGSFWAGVACVIMAMAMYRAARGRTGGRRIAFVIAVLCLFMSLYAAFETGRRHRREQASTTAAP